MIQKHHACFELQVEIDDELRSKKQAQFAEVCETAPNVAAAAAEAMKMFAACPNASQRLKRKVSSAAVLTFGRCSKISASGLRVQAVNETGDG